MMCNHDDRVYVGNLLSDTPIFECSHCHSFTLYWIYTRFTTREELEAKVNTMNYVLGMNYKVHWLGED